MAVVDLTRFFDALTKLYPEAERASVARTLISGANRHETCLDILTMFPETELLVLGVDEAAVDPINEGLGSLESRVHLLPETFLSHAQEGDEFFDLILIRHPEIMANPPAWDEAVKAISGRLNSKGLVIISFFNLPEATFIDQMMEPLPTELIIGSPYTAEPVALRGNDRYILAYRRKLEIG